jgi:hypothetical protein
MRPEQLALIVSIVSVLISSVALGWNIYRDIILKARVRVSFSVVSILHESFPERPQYLYISATNFGPGAITLNMILAKEPLWRRILRKEKYVMITPYDTHPLSRSLPAKLEVGDMLQLLLPFERDCFLAGPFSQVGLNDYFGRNHWASRKDIVRARLEWKKEFGSET